MLGIGNLITGLGVMPAHAIGIARVVEGEGATLVLLAAGACESITLVLVHRGEFLSLVPGHVSLLLRFRSSPSHAPARRRDGWMDRRRRGRRPPSPGLPPVACTPRARPRACPGRPA